MTNRSAMRDAAREELSVGSGDTTIWTNAELNRAVDEVTADFSRLIPEEKIKEYTLRPAVTSEAFTSSSAHATFKALANKPIEPYSETVKNNAETTTYTRDTDYEIDYANGEIATLSAGAIAVSSALKVTYTKSKISLDISGLTTLIAPFRVELPVLQGVPWSEAEFMTWADILYITSIEKETQYKWADKNHLRLYYYGQHTAPTDTVDGTFPRFLDEVMIKGIVAYALFIKHRERTLQAITDSDSARTALGNLTTPFTNFDTAITALTTAGTGVQALLLVALDALKTATSGPYARIDTALADLRTATSGPLARIDTSLANLRTLTSGIYDRMDTALAAIIAAGGPQPKMATALDALVAAANVYAKIDSQLALIGARHTAAQAALTSAATQSTDGDTAVDTVTTRVTESKTALDKIAAILDRVWKTGSPNTGILQEAEDLWSAAQHNQEMHVKDAKTGLLVGNSLINKVNVGADAAELSRRFAESRLNLAQILADRRKDFITEARELIGESDALVAESSQRLNGASARIGEAQARSEIARNYIQEAVQELEQVRLYILEATEWNNKGRLYLDESRGWAEKGNLYLGETDRWYAKGQLYLAETQRWEEKATLYINEAQSWLGKADRYLAEAQGRANQGQLYLTEALRWLEKCRTYTEQAATYLSLSQRDLEVSEQLLKDARERHTDYWQILVDRVQSARRTSISSVRQYPQPAMREQRNLAKLD